MDGAGTPDSAPQVKYESSDGVAIVMLDRPEQLNRWTPRMAVELTEALRRADADPGVGAVVLVGAGRAFCAGLDLDSAPSFEADERPEPEVLPWQISKPVVAAINGHAIGVGATLALTADMRFVAGAAKLQFPFVRLGLVSELGSHLLLARLAGLEVAADLLLSGRMFLGEEACNLGIASRCLDASDVLPAAVAWAREVAASTDRDAVATSKRLLWHDVRQSLAEVSAMEVEALGRLARGPGARLALGRLRSGTTSR
jgi:enoyl-CoA hydratase/carnithine racemase